MINENNLRKYYSEIASKLDELIPCEWDKVALYAEETGDVRSVSFYFFTDEMKKVHHSGDIPEEYNVSRGIFKSLLRELLEINNELWLEFKEAGEQPWNVLNFYLDSEWNFKVKYGYDRDIEIGRFEREIRWAYNELGIIPNDDYEKELLEEYLKEKVKGL